MSFFILFRYFIHSLRSRGFLATLRIPLLESYYEKFFGIRSSGMKVSNSNDYYHYQGATYFALMKVMNELKPYTTNYSFMDIGCGKGRAMVVSEYFGFKKISGIDLDKELVDIANNNVASRKHTRANTEFNVQCVNALDMKYPNEPTVYFLFNPFNKVVMDGVLKNICRQNKHRNVFVYMNPTAREAFNSSDFKQIKEIRTKNYTEAIMFEQLTSA